jgi:type IV secretory pathway TrbD component
MNEWTIRKALTQPILVMGTERPLLILNITMCFCYVLGTRFSWYAIWGVILFLVIHSLCLMITKHDPRAVAVFKRSTRYRGFYPATGGAKRVYTRKFSAFPEEIRGQ